MESFLMKSGLSLIALYVFYRVMLRYERNHQLNRFMGLACILFSIGLPFVQFKDVSKNSQFSGVFHVMTRSTADFQETVSSAWPDSAVNIFLILYILGAGVCLLRCVVGLATLVKLYVVSPKSHHGGFTVVGLNRHMSPFTFFSVLFIGTNRIDDSEMETMMLHERVHRDQYHSIDAVFLEILTVIFWFNPVIWFFRKDIKAEHEYFADERVLAQGINPVDYQLMLFKARTGTSIEFGNYLSNKTSLIKRFHMMTNEKSKPNGSYWRVSLFLALMSVIVFLSAFSSGKERPQVDKVATYEEGEAAMYRSLMQRIKYPATARNENRSGKVRVSFTVNENGKIENIKTDARDEGYLLKECVVVAYSQSSEEAKGLDDAMKEESVRVVEGFGKFIPAEKDGKPVSSVLTLPIQFKIDKN